MLFRSVSIEHLATIIGSVVGFEGRIQFDSSKPDGAPRKLMDSARIEAMGWKAKIKLREGLKDTYHWFLENESEFRV